MISKLRAIVPFAQIRPMRTFFSRSKQKFFVLYGHFFGLSGAIPGPDSVTGNGILKLRFRSALGDKGDEIEIPKDGVIYEHVRKSGSWETNSSYFLSKTLRALEKQGLDGKTAFVDLGSNSGLVTLQTLRYSNSSTTVLVIEPLPKHVQAIKNNLRKLALPPDRLRIFEFALGHQDGIFEILTENNNKGNSSFLPSAVQNSTHVKTKVVMRKAADFFTQNLATFQHLVIKSDLQGMDANVLSVLPQNILNNVESAVVEVWALPDINPEDVENFIKKVSISHFLGWSEATIGKIQPESVGNFWLSKSSLAKDLYMRKK
jgi:FkbM family methyltransferase